MTARNSAQVTLLGVCPLNRETEGPLSDHTSVTHLAALFMSTHVSLFQLYRASALFETIRHEAQHSTDYKLSLFDLQTSCYQALQRVLVSLGMFLSTSHIVIVLSCWVFFLSNRLSIDPLSPQATTMRLWQWLRGVAHEPSPTCWWRGRRASRTQTPTPL